jgi:hypothetical protein
MNRNLKNLNDSQIAAVDSEGTLALLTKVDHESSIMSYTGRIITSNKLLNTEGINNRIEEVLVKVRQNSSVSIKVVWHLM